MPKKKVVTRSYTISDGRVIELCNEKRTFIERDIAEFAVYNIDAPAVAIFKTETDEFEEFVTDEEMVGVQEEKTDLKDAAGEAVKTVIRSIMVRVAAKYKEGSARYKRFGTVGMDTFDDPHLLSCGRRVKRVASALLAELASKGLTQAIIDDLTAKNQAFEDAIDTQAEAIADRDIATEDRIEMGNARFSRLMELCSMGKNIWFETDEAKYNDYIVYDTPGGNVIEPPPPPPET